MKVAIALMHVGDGGLTKVMLTIARGLAVKGIEVDLLLLRREPPTGREHVVPDTVNVVNLSASRISTSLLALLCYLKKSRPDVLMAGGPPCNCISILSRLLSRQRVKLIVAEHSLPSVDVYDGQKVVDRIIPFLMRRLYRYADHVVAVSSAAAQDLSNFIGYPRDHIEVIHNPIVAGEVFGIYNDAARAGEVYDDGRPTVLFVGRLVGVKNITLLLKSFALVREQLSARLVLVGEGAQQGQLANLSRALGISEDVRFVGYAGDPDAYMRGADVLVLCSHWEGFGNVLIEAMACGTQVIATNNLDGAKEILRNGEYGQLVPSNVEALAEAIVNVISGKVVYNHLEARAMDFTIEASISRYLELIRR